MKKFLLIAMMLPAMSPMLTAQYTHDWTQSCGNYNKTSVMSAVDGEDNLIVTGYLQSENIYTRKYDKAGNFLWESTDGSGLPGKYEKPLWITCDADDNVFVVGKRYSISSVWEFPDAIVAIKYDPWGSLLWKQEIPVTVLVGSQHPAFNLRAETDPDGNLYIGTVAATPAGFVLSKIDPSGTLLFTNNSIAVPVNGFWSMRLRDERIVLSGGGSLQAPVSVWDLDGSLLWTAAPDGRGARDVEMDEEGNLYILSSFSNQVSPTSGEDMVLYKFNATGTQQWKQDFDLGGYEYASLCVYTPGKLSIAGYGFQTGSIYFDWKVLQVDTEGSMLWSAFYDGTAYNDEYPHFISANQQGDVFVTGRGGPSPDPMYPSAMQMVIVEYTNGGILSWSDTPNQYGGWGLACQLASDNSLFAISSAEMTLYHYVPVTTAVLPMHETGQRAKIGPVPVKDLLWVYLEGHDPGVRVEIYDPSGLPVRSTILAGEQERIDLSSVAPGIYICRVVTGNHAESHKIIKQ